MIKEHAMTRILVYVAIPIRISHLYHAAALDHAPYVVRASRLIRYMSCKPSFRWLRT